MIEGTFINKLLSRIVPTCIRNNHQLGVLSLNALQNLLAKSRFSCSESKSENPSYITH